MLYPPHPHSPLHLYPQLPIHNLHPSHITQPSSILPIPNSTHIILAKGRPTTHLKNLPLVWNNQFPPESDPLRK